MWEKEILDEDAKPENVQISVDKSTVPKTEDTNILILQSYAVVVIVVIVILIKTLFPDMYTNLRTEYTQIMSKGADVASQTEIIRFANGFVNELRENAQELLNKIETSSAKGGYAPANSDITRLSVTNSRFKITDKLFCPAMGLLSSHFGIRQNPVLKAKDFHEGIDIAAPLKSGVFAALSGTVMQTGYNKIRGNFIVIKHSNSLQTLYQHLYSVKVKKGDFVEKGVQIGLVGSTGMSTGAHLHFEIIIDNVRVNPGFALILDQL